jgi:hypothetical protein
MAHDSDPRVPAGAYIAVIFALVYLALPTRVLYWDGIAFAITIENARSWHELIDVHHLVYDFAGWAEYKLLGGHVRALFLMQWTNGVLGGALLWCAYRLFRLSGVSPASSAACAAILGASATFWRFATDADAYIAADLFLVGAYCLIPRSPRAGALLHLGAMLFHQLSALFFPVALALLWRRSRRDFGKNALVYSAISAGGALSTYALAYRLASRLQARTFGSWLTYHSAIPFVFHPWTSLRWLAVGTGRLFVGGKMSSTAMIAGPLALVLLGASVLGIARMRNRLAHPWKEWPLAVWTISYAGFLCFWEPHNTFYRLFYLVPLIGIMAVATRAMPPRYLASLAAALLCWNFFQFIYPHSRIENDPPLAAALAWQKRWPGGTGVIYAQFVPDLWIISYFNPQVSWMVVQPPDASRVAAQAAAFARDGGKVYLDWTYLQSMGIERQRFTFEQVSP